MFSYNLMSFFLHIFVLYIVYLHHILCTSILQDQYSSKVIFEWFSYSPQIFREKFQTMRQSYKHVGEIRNFSIDAYNFQCLAGSAFFAECRIYGQIIRHALPDFAGYPAFSRKKRYIHGIATACILYQRP